VSGGVPWAFTFAALSFDVLALGSLRLRVFRHVGVGFPPPPRLSTAWRWGWVASASASFDTLALGPSASASFDTLALGCPRLRVFRHLGIGPPPPPRFSTPWRWVPFASVVGWLPATLFGLRWACRAVLRFMWSSEVWGAEVGLAVSFCGPLGCRGGRFGGFANGRVGGSGVGVSRREGDPYWLVVVLKK